MHIASIGIDLGKNTFHLVALDDHGNIVIRKKFSRRQLLAYTANLPTSLVGIEACSGAHFIGAALRDQGHDVRLIPAQFVKPFLKSNKNDFLCSPSYWPAPLASRNRRGASSDVSDLRRKTTVNTVCTERGASVTLRAVAKKKTATSGAHRIRKTKPARIREQLRLSTRHLLLFVGRH